jgi:hypothetical protein
MKHALTAAFVIGLAGLAHAQGGFGGGGGMRDRERIPWVRGGMDRAVSGGVDALSPQQRRLLKAQGTEPSDKKYIFVYVRGTKEETTEPREVANCADAVDAARGAWLFVLVDFDPENLWQKSWGIKTGPACLGCDIFGNDFLKFPGLSIDIIRTVVKGTPAEVQKYEAKLKYDFQKASDLVKTDEEKGAKLFVDICLFGKTGYKEVGESHTKLTELTESSLRKGELATAVSPEMGVDYLEDLVKVYRATSPGVKAEVMLALLEHARGNVQPAIQRLLKVLKYDARSLKSEIESAQKALDEISKAGDLKIDAALAGDKAVAKEILRKLARDYAGTEAAKHAADASK